MLIAMKSTIAFSIFFLHLILAFAKEQQLQRESGGNKQPRIIDGVKATPGQIPWHVHVTSLLADAPYTYHFGGVLLTNEWVLTVAEGVKRFDRFRLTLGATDLENLEEEGRETRDGIWTEVHPDWNETMEHNIALIRMTEPITTNIFIKPIRITESNLTYPQIVNASGFGELDNETYDNYLLTYGNFETVPKEECNSNEIQSAKEIICLKGINNFFPCDDEDYGGGITIKEGNRTVVHSIMVYGNHRNCTSLYPAGALRLGAYIDWIRNYVPGV